MNADLLTNVNLSALMRFHSDERTSSPSASAATRSSYPSAWSSSRDTCGSLEEKPSFGFFVNAGIYAVTRKQSG